MEVSFTGTVEEWRSLFPTTSDTSQVLAAIADVKGTLIMVSAEAQKLDDITNSLKDTLAQVVAFITSKDAANQAAIATLTQSVADAQAALTAMTSQDTVDKQAAADAQAALADAQQQLADLKGSVSTDTGALTDVQTALAALGSNPSAPLPVPAPIDVPPPVDVPPVDAPPTP